GRCAASRPAGGRTPPLRRTRSSRCGERYAPSSPRHNGDTVHLLDRGLSAPHQIERRGADQPHARLVRQLLQLPHRHAIDDRLADLVVQHHELPYCLSAVVAGAAAVTASASLAELVGDAGYDWNVRFLEELARGHVGLR